MRAVAQLGRPELRAVGPVGYLPALLAAGTRTKTVQEQLGHSSYAITADIYSPVSPAQAREAADRLDAAIKC